jgi:AraC-like DNA-binding protein
MRDLLYFRSTQVMRRFVEEEGTNFFRLAELIQLTKAKDAMIMSRLAIMDIHYYFRVPKNPENN